MIQIKQEINSNMLTRLQKFVEFKQREKFHEHFPKDSASLYQELYKRKHKIDKLVKQKIIRQQQYDLIFPPSSETDSKDFDSTLLHLLLRTVCGFQKPITGWNDEPRKSDRSEMTNLVRLKLGRNLISHLGIANTTDIEFRKIYQYLKQPLLDLGCAVEDLNKLPPIQLNYLPAVPSFINQENPF